MSAMEGEMEFEFSEEELVDFEGSDYSIGLDEEFGDEEVGSRLTSTKVENFLLEDIEHVKQPERRISYPFSGDQINTAVCSTSERPEVEAGDAALKLSDIRHSCSQEGAESGEIEEDKDQKEDCAVSKTNYSFDNKNLEDKGCQGRDRKHLRADLEDGELEDAATPEAFDYEGEGNTEACRISNKCISQERKKRNFMYLSEWQRDEKGKESLEAQSTAMVVMQNYSRGRRSDRSGNFPRFKHGSRGNMHIFGHPHSNLAPGIMAPTRPLMPRGMRGPVNQFGVPLGMPTPIHFQEALMQEQMMMSNHALHLGVNGHPSFNVDISPHPLFGMDYFGARPRDMMHIQPNRPGMIPPINCFGAFENTSRVQRPIFGVRRSLGRGSCANIGGRGGSFARNGFGRPAAWSLSPFDLPAVGRGRGRSQLEPLSCGHEQSVNTQRVQFSAEGGLGHEVPIIDVNNADEMKQDGRKTWNPMESENIASSKMANVTQQQSNSGNIERNGPPSASLSFVKSHSISTLTKSSIEDDGKTVVSSMLQASTSMIKLGVPVQRSRALSVGGLPEGTPLSVVIEAFEKQGKIMQVMGTGRDDEQMDWKLVTIFGNKMGESIESHKKANEGGRDVKKEKEDMFIITFSTLPEAVSAKRLLHRSILGGHQITVDYSV